MKASGPQFFPNLLNRIHFRRVRRNEYDLNIGKRLQRPGLVPCRTIADEHNVTVWIFCGQVLQKEIHANGIAVWKNKEAAITRHGINSTVSIAILSDMMAGHPRTDAFSAPAILRLVDTTETCFILEHEPNTFGIVENFGQFMDSGVNFFEASIASGVALFGCLLLGSFLLQP